MKRGWLAGHVEMTRGWWAAVALAAAASVSVAVVLCARALGVDAALFTRDPTTIAEVPPYVGSISVLTTSLWFSAAALCTFVGRVGPVVVRAPLCALAALQLALGLDDAFLLHEVVGPWLFQEVAGTWSGLPEVLIFGLYAVAGCCVMRSFQPLRRSAVGAAFSAGAAFLVLSVLSDLFITGPGGLAYVVEDGLKLAGVCLWMTVPLYAWALRTAPATAPGRAWERVRTSTATGVGGRDEVVSRRAGR